MICRISKLLISIEASCSSQISFMHIERNIVEQDLKIASVDGNILSK